MNNFIPATTPIDRGLTLLEASAGTGKTYSLVRIIIRELVEKEIEPDAILTVTFTRAATAEIKSRLQSLLQETLHQIDNPADPEANDLVKAWHNNPDINLATAKTKLAFALASFDSIPIFTIDGFFQRLLKEHAFESQILFNTELETDISSLRQTALRDYWRQHVYSLEPAALEHFQQHVTFDAADNFLKSILPKPNIKLDRAYNLSLSEIAENKKQADDNFRTVLQKCWQDLVNFLSNPPGNPNKHKKHFQKNGSKILTALESDTPEHSLVTTSTLTDPSLSKDKIPYDLTDIKLTELAHAADQVDLAQGNPTASYLGQILTFVSRRFQKLKSEKNIQSYDDITNTLASLLNSNTPSAKATKSVVTNRYKAALIDEFQDTSPQQCAVFLALFHHPRNTENRPYFHIIGDPKQSIYRFRGADVFAYIEASQKADHRYSLLTNFRSTPSIIHATNQIFQLSNDPFLTTGKIAFSPSNWPDQSSEIPTNPTPSLHIREIEAKPGNQATTPSREAIYHDIAHQIRNLLDRDWSQFDDTKEKSGPIQPADIAVLVSAGHEASSIQDLLTDLHIPASLGTRSSLLESPETEDVITLLTALLEPRRSPAIRSALLLPALGHGKLLDDDSTFNTITNIFADLHTHWNEKGLMPAIQLLLTHFDIRATLLSLENGQRRITNFLHLIELLDTTARDKKLSPSATLQWLIATKNDGASSSDNEILELRISTDQSAVKLVTQHSCKGLEFPITIVLPSSGIVTEDKKIDHIYHDENGVTHFAPFHDSSHRSFEQRVLENQADRARLAYVALTRAIYQCYFYLPQPITGRETEHAVHKMLGHPTTDDLQNLAQHSSGTITHTFVPTDYELPDLPPYQPGNLTEAQNLTTRPTGAITITTNRRTTSFTGITRNAPDIIHDVDLTPSTPAPPADNFWALVQGGASLGLVFHEILEEIDFQDTSGLENLTDQKLKKYQPWRTPPKENYPAILQGITQNIKTLLTHKITPDLTLDQLSNKHRLNEADFLLDGENFSLTALTQVLRNDPPPHLPAHYIQQLENLPPATTRGFLDGIIDLIYLHQGRYHIIDWKTNQLPNNSIQAIAEAMAHHHYYLQYHLYTLALDRFLQQRLGAKYDPAQHLGSTHYVFLRAVNPEIPHSGIYTDTLTPTRLLNLRETFKTTTATA